MYRTRIDILNEIKKLQREYNWLSEGITDFRTFGIKGRDDGSLTLGDQRAVTAKSSIQRIMDSWNKIPFDFALYFVNIPDSSDLLYSLPVSGIIDENQLKMFGSLIEIEPIVTSANRNNIVLIYKDNPTGGNRHSFTSWILAHRLSHAIYRGRVEGASEYHKNAFDLFKEWTLFLEEKILNVFFNGLDALPYLYDLDEDVFCHIGTMKSARENSFADNYNEFYDELFAQYLINGRIKFNPVDVELITKIATNIGVELDEIYMSQQVLQEINTKLHDVADEMMLLFNQSLSELVGKILIV